MNKRKNGLNVDTTNINKNNMILMGIVLVLLVATGILPLILEIVFGIVGLVVSLTVGMIGLVIGLAAGLIGLVLGLIGGAIGLVVGLAPIILPVAIVVYLVRNNRSNTEKAKNDFI